MDNTQYLAISTTPWLYSKSSPVKYSYFSNSPGDNAENLADSSSKSYWTWFALIFCFHQLMSFL